MLLVSLCVIYQRNKDCKCFFKTKNEKIGKMFSISLSSSDDEFDISVSLSVGGGTSGGKKFVSHAHTHYLNDDANHVDWEYPLQDGEVLHSANGTFHVDTQGGDQSSLLNFLSW